METRRCPCCAREIASPVCPSCGFPVQNYNDLHHLPIGTVLRGRYQVGRVLGQGGFGITYLGWDLLMETVVAIKEFYPSSTVNRNSSFSTHVQCNTSQMAPHYQASLERFLREAKALVRFRDIPEIVDILDFIEENNTAYIIMEFVRGVDLAKYIQSRGGRLSADETFRILKPVMEALAAVHKKGIIHRDISPDNIVLDPMGGAKLLDFGAVRAVENPDVDKGLAKSTEAILKHGFAPIEQYNTRGSLGPWTDEYAMCATIWYCLTGTIAAEASIRISEGIDPDWNTVPGLTDGQRRALEKGLSVRAKDRYPDMDSLLQALFSEADVCADPFFKTEPIAARPAPVANWPSEMPAQTPVSPAPVPSGYPEKPRRKKGGLIAAIAALLVVAIAAGLALPALFKGSEDTHRDERPENGRDTVVNQPEPDHAFPVPEASLVSRVALITDGGLVDDRSFNQACWEGVVQWCESRFIEHTYYVPPESSSAGYIAAIEQAIAEGADTVVLPGGYAFGPILTYLADAYPSVRFIAVDTLPTDLTQDYVTYYEPSANTACLNFAEEQAGFLAGYAAVMDGFTRLGFLGGMEVPAIVQYGSGFIQGANTAAAQMGIAVEVRCAFANQFFGSPEITEQICSWYHSGTEVIFTCGGGLYTSTVEAARGYGGYVIGVDVDQSGVDNCVLTSAAKNLTLATMTLLDAANTGAWDQYGGKFTTFSLAQGAYLMLPQSADSWRFHSFSTEQYDTLLEQLATGKIIVDPDQTLTHYQGSPGFTVIVED